MKKLSMVLFLFGTVSVFCNAQTNGHYIKDSGNLTLFADGEPRTSSSIDIEAGKSVEIRLTQPSTGDLLWQKMNGSDYIQFNPGGSGRFALIWTQSANKGDSAILYVTGEDSDILTITIHAY